MSKDIEKINKLLYEKDYYSKLLEFKQEDIIFCNFFVSKDFYNKVFSYLNKDILNNVDSIYLLLYRMIIDFVKVNNVFPKYKLFYDYIINRSNFRDIEIEQFEEYRKKCLLPFIVINGKFPILNLQDLSDLFYVYTEDKQLFLKNVETWIKQKSLENAILKSVEILEKSKDVSNYDKIENYIKDALKFSFDMNIGLRYVEDVDKRIERYKQKFKFVKFQNKELFNHIFGGGLLPKSLYIVIAPPNFGKTTFLCSMTCDLLMEGKNVLYITGEMSEDQITKRIDANLLNIPIYELGEELDEDKFKSKFQQFIQRIKNNNLIVKEYPTSTASTSMIESYIDDLIVKENFKPDVIVVDYLALFLSSRLSKSSSNSYEYIKSLTEELRAIAVKRDCIVLTATQVNREGSKKKTVKDVKETDIADGFSAVFTADWVGVLFRDMNLTLDDEGYERILKLKVLKTRFSSNVGFIYTLKTDFKYMRIIPEKKDTEEDEVEEIKQEIKKKEDILNEIKVENENDENEIDDYI